jgi:hypothetical protein
MSLVFKMKKILDDFTDWATVKGQKEAIPADLEFRPATQVLPENWSMPTSPKSF